MGTVIICALSACAAARVADAASHDSPAAAPVFVYIATKGRNCISQFAASPSHGGALTPLKPATAASGPFPSAVAIDPQTSSAYVTAVGAPVNEVSQ
jgi:hypothetical protein